MTCQETNSVAQPEMDPRTSTAISLLVEAEIKAGVEQEDIAKRITDELPGDLAMVTKAEATPDEKAARDDEAALRERRTDADYIFGRPRRSREDVENDLAIISAVGLKRARKILKDRKESQDNPGAKSK